MTALALQTVPFHGDKVCLVVHEGRPYVPLKPICGNLGVSWPRQFRKLREQPKRWAIVALSATAANGKTCEMVSMPLTRFPAFLYTMRPNKVRPEIREKLETYQNECDQALWDYWSKGQAMNPRAAEPHEAALTLAQAQKEAQAFFARRVSMTMGDYLRLSGRRVIPREVTQQERLEMIRLHDAGMSPEEIHVLSGRSLTTVNETLERHRRNLPTKKGLGELFD